MRCTNNCVERNEAVSHGRRRLRRLQLLGSAVTNEPASSSGLVLTRHNYFLTIAPRTPANVVIIIRKLYCNCKAASNARGKGKSIAVCEPHLTATGNHMPYGITQCYLPPGRGDFHAFTPAEAGTRFSDPEGMQG